MKPVPILLYSDNPSLHTGLARITRHLAVLLGGMPEFKVGTFGRGGIVSRKLPFTQYNFPEAAEWGQSYLPVVWDNFAGDQRGIIFTIMDAARMHWFTHPELFQNEGGLVRLLKSGKFERWGYFPIDHACVNGDMSQLPREAVARYDKVLGYSIFGSTILSRVRGKEEDFIPHGLNTAIFYPRGKEGLRWSFQIPNDMLVIGMVATNQVRKDWPMACQITRELLDKGLKVRLLCIIDDPVRYWNVEHLAKDFNIVDEMWIVEGSMLTDSDLANYYSLCDVTILPTMGEGFGYPLVESQACGTPAITVNYAGGAELVPQECLIDPVAWRTEAPLNALRPVTHVSSWVETISRVVSDSGAGARALEEVSYLSWDRLGEVWKRKFREWLEEFNSCK